MRVSIPFSWYIILPVVVEWRPALRFVESMPLGESEQSVLDGIGAKCRKASCDFLNQTAPVLDAVKKGASPILAAVKEKSAPLVKAVTSRAANGAHALQKMSLRFLVGVKNKLFCRARGLRCVVKQFPGEAEVFYGYKTTSAEVKACEGETCGGDLHTSSRGGIRSKQKLASVIRVTRIQYVGKSDIGDGSSDKGGTTVNDDTENSSDPLGNIFGDKANDIAEMNHVYNALDRVWIFELTTADKVTAHFILRKDILLGSEPTVIAEKDPITSRLELNMWRGPFGGAGNWVVRKLVGGKPKLPFVLGVGLGTGVWMESARVFALDWRKVDLSKENLHEFVVATDSDMWEEKVTQVLKATNVSNS